MKKIVVACLCSLLAVAAFAGDGRKMDKAEVIERFTDVTFDGIYLPKNKKFMAYDAPDGKLEILRPNGKRDKGRTWFVNDDGQRCATSPKWNAPRCFKLFDMGNGEYHQYLDGKHVHTLSNLRSGNHL